MRRQVDHHLARARAVGRRGSAQSRADVWASLTAVSHAVDRLFPEVVIDLDGTRVTPDAVTATFVPRVPATGRRCLSSGSAARAAEVNRSAAAIAAGV